MGILKRCPGVNCYELIPEDATDCGCRANYEQHQQLAHECTVEWCHEPKVRGRLNLCVGHREENRQQKIKDSNDRGTVKRTSARVAKKRDIVVDAKGSRLCAETNCTNTVIGKSIRCPACKSKIREAYSSGYERERAARKAEEALMIVPDKPQPRRPPPQLVTDAEQRKIDRAVADKLNRSCGYGHGAARTLSKAEIAALEGKITHISKIPAHRFGPREAAEWYQ